MEEEAVSSPRKTSWKPWRNYERLGSYLFGQITPPNPKARNDLLNSYWAASKVFPLLHISIGKLPRTRGGCPGGAVSPRLQITLLHESQLTTHGVMITSSWMWSSLSSDHPVGENRVGGQQHLRIADQSLFQLPCDRLGRLGTYVCCTNNAAWRTCETTCSVHPSDDRSTSKVEEFVHVLYGVDNW